MADPREEAINKKLAEFDKKMAEFNAKVDEFRGLSEAEQQKRVDFITNQISLANQLKASYEGLEKRITKLKEADTPDEAKISKLKGIRDEIEKQIDPINKVIKTNEKLGGTLDNLLRKNMNYQRYLKLSNAGTRDYNKNLLEVIKQEGVVEGAAGIASGVFAGFQSTIQGLTAEMAALAVVMPNINFATFMNVAAGGVNKFDRQFRKIMKTGFTFQENMQAIFRGAMTPAAAFKDFPELKKVTKDMLTTVGIESDEVSRSFIALKKNAMIFTPDFIQRNAAFTVQLTNLFAGLNKLGVGFDTSAKSFDIFSKVLKQAPKEAMKSSKKLITIAKSLDITTGKAFEDFNKLMPTLAQFGDRAIDVFGRLAAQARATGVEISTLSKVAQGLDTFQGAAKAAQGLNAILGGTFISVTDLVRADFPQKIELIRAAFERSGRTFATSHRRIKMMVAAQLGTDVGTAARIFGSEEEYKSVTDRLDTSAMSTEELMQKMAKQMTSAEHLKKGIQNLAGGFSQLVDASRKVAKDASNVLVRSFASIESEIKSADMSLLGFLGHLKLMSGIAKVRGKLVGAVAAGAAFDALSEKQKEQLMEHGIKTVEDLGKMTVKGAEALLRAIGAGGALDAIGDFFSDASAVNNDKANRAVAGVKDAEKNRGKTNTELASNLQDLLKNFREVPITMNLTVEIEEEKVSQISKNATIDLLERTLTLT